MNTSLIWGKDNIHTQRASVLAASVWNPLSASLVLTLTEPALGSNGLEQTVTSHSRGVAALEEDRPRDLSRRVLVATVSTHLPRAPGACRGFSTSAE